MPEIIPAKNYVLLKPLGEIKTTAGLYTPTDQSKKPEMGRVYKIGAGTQPFPVKMKAGDIVLYKKYMSNETPIPIINEVINPIPFEDLTALIKEDK